MANGLLDFLQTPAGTGLLSAVAGGMAGARRGQPWNNAGRAGLAGLTGYAQAQDDILRKQEQDYQKQFRQMQMDKMQSDLATAQAAKEWKTGLPGMLEQSRPKVEGFKPDTFDETDNPFGQMANVTPGNPQALQSYLMQPSSPFADKLIEQQLFPKAPDYKTVGNTLLQVGTEGVKPVYTAAEKDKLPWYVKQDEQGKTQYDPAYLTNQERLNRAGAGRQTTIVNPALDPFKNEQSLRKEYQDNPYVKAGAEMNNAFRTIEAAYARPSAANDLAMATKYMKILDPASVVRESEFALAVNATGLMDKVYNYANMVKTGQKLNPNQRKDFYDSAKAINDAFQSETGKVQNTYRGIAAQYGLSPDNTTLGPEFKQKENKPNPKSKLIKVDGKTVSGVWNPKIGKYTTPDGKFVIEE